MKDYSKDMFRKVHGRSPKGGELKRLRISMYGMEMLDMVNLANVQGGWSATEGMPDNSYRAQWQKYMSGDAPEYIEELSYVTNVKLRVFKNDLMKMGAKEDIIKFVDTVGIYGWLEENGDEIIKAFGYLP